MIVRVRDGCVGVEVCPASSGKHISRLIGDIFAGFISQVGSELGDDVLLICPDIIYLCTLRNGVFGNNFRSDLVGPVDLENSMVMSKDQYALIIHVIRVDSKFSEARVCSVAANNDYSLLSGNVELDDSTMVIQDVDVSKVDLEVHDGQLTLIEEGSIHDTDSPWLHWFIDRHYFSIGVIIVAIIDMLGKVGPDEVVVAIFGVESYLSVEDIAEWHVHVVFYFSQKCLRC